MDWQLPLVGVLVAGAIAYIARLIWRAWHPAKGSCGGGCGCATKPAAKGEDRSIVVPSDQLTLRRRAL